MTTHTITVEPVGREVECDEDQTILDACLRAGVWLPHSCTHGTCATCKVDKLDGEVDLGEASSFALMDFERDEGKLLTCCAKPRGDVTIEADLDEMDAMIGSTLAYLRGDEEQEEVRSADIAAMLQTLCGDAEDMGKAVTYEGPPQARLPCRAIALKRAFANVIDNAVKYGTSARVVLADRGRELVIHVDDAGPGVPEEQLESVFQPFYRLEESRNRGTGGSGLGLAIARQAVGHHGGSVTLQNLAGGGLRASIRLPRPA